MTIKSVGKNCIFIRLFLVKNNVYTVINNTHLGLDISFYISILFFLHKHVISAQKVLTIIYLNMDFLQKSRTHVSIDLKCIELRLFPLKLLIMAFKLTFNTGRKIG